MDGSHFDDPVPPPCRNSRPSACCCRRRRSCCRSCCCHCCLPPPASPPHRPRARVANLHRRAGQHHCQRLPQAVRGRADSASAEGLTLSRAPCPHTPPHSTTLHPTPPHPTAAPPRTHGGFYGPGVGRAATPARRRLELARMAASTGSCGRPARRPTRSATSPRHQTTHANGGAQRRARCHRRCCHRRCCHRRRRRRGGGAGGGGGVVPLQCEQLAGEVLVVPFGWGHDTLNPHRASGGRPRST